MRSRAARVLVRVLGWAAFVYLAVRAAQSTSPVIIATTIVVLLGTLLLVAVALLVSMLVRHDRENAVVELPPAIYERDAVGHHVVVEPAVATLSSAQVIAVQVDGTEKIFRPVEREALPR